MPKAKAKPKKAKTETWTVYILQCADGTLYTGITNNLPRRLQQHESGTGAKYTCGRGPFTVVHAEKFPGRSAALKREILVKSLDKRQKMQLAGL